MGLPDKLFINTAIPVVLMVFKKKQDHKGIYFIDASQDYEKGKKQNSLNEKHIQRIVDCYRSKKDESKYGRYVPYDEIRENDFNLNIPRYIDTSEEVVLPPISRTIDEICDIENEIDATELEIMKMLEQLEYTGNSISFEQDFKTSVARWKEHCTRKKAKKYKQAKIEEFL